MNPLPKVGDTVTITGVMNDPYPLAIGDRGIVTDVNAEAGQIHVKWDSGSRLMLLRDDPFCINPTTI